MDKLLHISFSYAITLTMYLFTGNIYISMGVGLAFASVKEIYDYISNGQDARERGKDLLCDGIGIISAAIIILLK